jgi:G3E family GTPase
MYCAFQYVQVRSLAESGKYEYILIESTGLGDPSHVASTFEFTDDTGFSLSSIARMFYV